MQQINKQWLQRLQKAYPILPEVDLYYNAQLLSLVDSFFRELYTNCNIRFSILSPSIGKFSFMYGNQIVYKAIEQAIQFSYKYRTIAGTLSRPYTFVFSKTVEYALRLYYKYIEYPIFHNLQATQQIANCKVVNELNRALPMVEYTYSTEENTINSYLLQVVSGYKFKLSTARKPKLFYFYLVYAFDVTNTPSFYTMIIPYSAEVDKLLQRASIRSLFTHDNTTNVHHVEEALQSIANTIQVYPTITNYLSTTN